MDMQGRCYHCGKVGHGKSDCPSKDKPAFKGKLPGAPKAEASPAPAPAPGPAAAGDGKPHKSGGVSPSHERDGYTPGAAADPATDKQARADRSSRHVHRTAGVQ